MSIAATSRGGATHWNGPPLGLITCRGDRCAQVVRSIRNWQVNVRQPPFRDIAYNHLICPGCGTVHVGRGWGVRSAANGTTAANREWHAWMVMVGGTEPLTDIAKVRLLELTDEHRRRYGRTRLTYHRAVRGGGTDCAGVTINSWISAGAPAPPTPIEDDMPYRDWPQADKDALLADVRRIIWGGLPDADNLWPDPSDGTPRNMATYARRTRVIERDVADLPGKVADAVASRLPSGQGGGVSAAELRDIVRAELARLKISNS